MLHVRQLGIVAALAALGACGIKGPPRPSLPGSEAPPSSAKVEQSPGRGPTSRAPLPDAQPDAGSAPLR